jgi:hypothetical protein
LPRGLAIAPAPLMRAFLIVTSQPRIQIALKRVERGIDALSERHPVELIEHRLMEAFADAIGLGALGFGARMVDVLDPQIELIGVVLGIAAILRASVGKGISCSAKKGSTRSLSRSAAVNGVFRS